MVTMEVSRWNGIPCPNQWCHRCEFQLPWDLGQFSSLPFWQKKKFCVDVEISEDTSCLDAAISIFNAPRNGPSKIQPLRRHCPNWANLVHSSVVTDARFDCHCILDSPMLFRCFFARKQDQCKCRSHWWDFLLYTVVFIFHAGKMNSVRFSVAFTRLSLRIVEVIATWPRLPRASVQCDLALQLSVMIKRAERRGYLQPPSENIPARFAFLLSHFSQKAIMICCISHCSSFSDSDMSPYSVCLWLKWKAARSWCESFSKVVPLMRFTWEISA